MLNIYGTVLQMSVTASVTAILLLVVKFILEALHCPRRIVCFLWLAIAFRLIVPISATSNVSIMNIMPQNIASGEQSIASAVSNNSSQIYLFPILWLSVAVIILSYFAVSAVLLKRRLRFSVKLRDNIYISEHISGSFVFGLINPKIYVGENISEQHLSSVIAHEKMHIRRCDHIVKAVACVILSIHWFNPLVWIMFRLFSQDIELACDEAVISKTDAAEKQVYIEALLESAASASATIYYKVCFASSPAKRRIKNILHFKKASKTLSVVCATLCIILSIAFTTNAKPSYTIIHKAVEGKYSYENNLYAKVTDFCCKDSGEIEITFDVNAPHSVHLVISDSKTEEIVESCEILAGSEPYVIYDLTPKKLYDIEIVGVTGNTWKIEGKYIID